MEIEEIRHCDGCANEETEDLQMTVSCPNCDKNYFQSLLDQKLNEQLDEIIDMVEEAKRLLPNNPQYSESELEYGKDLGRIEMNDQFFTKLKAMKEEK